MIPEAAVEAALEASLTFKSRRGMDNDANLMRHILAAAAPHMLAEYERRLADAGRMITLLVLEAGGTAAISSRAVAELEDGMVIETSQDVVNGGWIIRASRPTP